MVSYGNDMVHIKQSGKMQSLCITADCTCSSCGDFKGPNYTGEGIEHFLSYLQLCVIQCCYAAV
jgi:hypothetical protein